MNPNQAKILVVSAYDADNHQYWYHRLIDMYPQAQFTRIALPPVNFAWRQRGNALRIARDFADELRADYDMLMVTSAVDLATLRGLVPCLAQLPTLVYFHENPFAYPDSSRPGSAIDAQLTSMYTAIAADQCLFNSRHNLSSFMSGVAALLDRYPDEVPDGVVPSLLAKSRETPVPLARDLFDGAVMPRQGNSIRIAWNHRWGFDKGPERLLAFVQALDASDIDAQIMLLGHRSDVAPSSLNELIQRFSHLISFNGFESQRELYRARLATADVVLSTARHDFQGLSVMEAVAMGCVPLVPDRLSYPEFFAAMPRYRSSPDPAQEAASAVALLRTWRDNGFPEAPDVSQYSIDALEHQYTEVIMAL